MEIPFLLQVRTGSRRLPGKALKVFFDGMSLLEYAIERLYSRGAENIFVLTSTLPEDDAIEEICLSKRVPVFRGDLSDVQSRFINGARHFRANTFARATADNPFVDARLVQQAWQLHEEHGADYTSSKLNTTFPDGIETEIVNLDALIEVRELDRDEYCREHVTPYFYRSNQSGLRFLRVQDFSRNPDELSEGSLTIDTSSEFARLTNLARRIGHDGMKRGWEEILDYECQTQNSVI